MIFKEPKSETSIRTLVVPAALLQILKEHKKKQLEMQIKSYGKYNNRYNLVCTRDIGEPINPSTFSGVFSTFLKRHNLPEVRFHDLRHTNATLMLLSGIPAKVASSRLGHSTIGITMDLYTNVLQEMDQEAAEKLNNTIYK